MTTPNPNKVICSPCAQVFVTNQEYLAHPCTKADGASPTDSDYLLKTTTPYFETISRKALERGEARKE